MNTRNQTVHARTGTCKSRIILLVLFSCSSKVDSHNQSIEKPFRPQTTKKRKLTMISTTVTIRALIVLLYLVITNAFYQNTRVRFWGHGSLQRFSTSTSTSSLSMALTPVGPFCPYRSEAAQELDPRMEVLNSQGPDFTVELARIQIEMQAGQTPDPERLNKVADAIDTAVDQWENLVTRLRISSDFQTREYAKLTQAHLESNDVTIESTAAMMRWQGNCMRAMATNSQPPFPPPEVDIVKMMEQSQKAAEEGGGGGAPSMAAMQAAQAITASPFKPESFDSPNVLEEYETLVLDHGNLIDFGAKYDSFDPLGKLYFLDEIEKIEERWDVFFLRFKLMGVLDKEYKRQCDDFLASMNLTEEDYRKLLKKSHELMREDAEKERSMQM